MSPPPSRRLVTVTCLSPSLSLSFYLAVSVAYTLSLTHTHMADLRGREERAGEGGALSLSLARSLSSYVGYPPLRDQPRGIACRDVYTSKIDVYTSKIDVYTSKIDVYTSKNPTFKIRTFLVSSGGQAAFQC